MARLLSPAPFCVTLNDDLSGSKIPLFYRLPSTAERAAYSASQVIKDDSPESREAALKARIDHGYKILQGIGDDAFEKPGTDGKPVPISSDENSEHYDPAWREFVFAHADDLLAMLAVYVFDYAPSRAPRPGGAGTDPLPKTSPQSPEGSAQK